VVVSGSGSLLLIIRETNRTDIWYCLDTVRFIGYVTRKQRGPGGNISGHQYRMDPGDDLVLACCRSESLGTAGLPGARGRPTLFPLYIPLDILSTKPPLVAAFIPLQQPAAGHVVDRIGAEIQKDGQVTCLQYGRHDFRIHWPLPKAFRTQSE
jgi:hypothetical protein